MAGSSWPCCLGLLGVSRGSAQTDEDEAEVEGG